MMRAIAECAFITSDLPVVLSLEMHCSQKQQQRAAEIAIHHLGKRLMLVSR